ncbi:DUF547 domain-containing protein [Leptolyngbya sp. FACHB-261]|uniref:DUF547 domain-containing protein n=1 Tax=Leptolyngbya sp. FACHB-261 TaxID=2692806 RepID=UPI0016837322|nr:DUF547 domain-containing protein [Leptolyngbya sp. FACHB-261]MBD2104545.1 DUF547 domain-containing protein [Leptolyngbya sp. FACHB-261]
MLNFSVWDSLLRQYVDDQGRVDYGAWQNEQPDALTPWLAELASFDLQTQPDTDFQLAFWVNAYNACAISDVLSRYPIDSIRPRILGVPNWPAFLWFFLKPTYVVAKRRLSLNQIEHNILRRDFAEPRIHFALVCASVGCPLLRAGAYWPEQVRQQLEEDASRFINNPEKVHYEPETNTLHCSQILKWYRDDFCRVAPSAPDYIRRYLKTDFSTEPLPQIRYLPYDWSLNQRKS